MDQPTATMLAAIVILVGGVISYGFQKWLDRREERHRQFRQAIFDYLAAGKAAESHLLDTAGETANKEVSTYEANFITLRMMSPPRVVLSLDRHRIALGNLHNALEQDDDEGFHVAFDEIDRALADLEASCRTALGVTPKVDPYSRRSSNFRVPPPE